MSLVRVVLIVFICSNMWACSKVDNSQEPTNSSSSSFPVDDLNPSSDSQDSPGNDDLNPVDDDDSSDDNDQDSGMQLLPDTTAPIITLISPSDEALVVDPCVGFIDPGAQLIDETDGTETIYAQVEGIDFRLTSDGEFEVTYTGSDQAGNEATPVTRTLVVEKTGITSTQELSEISNDMDGDYKLCNDISIIGFWLPIGGTSSNPPAFTGSLSGLGPTGERYRISDLKISSSANIFHSGLFAVLNDAVVEDIIFEDVGIDSVAPSTSTNTSAGLIAGRSQQSQIRNIQFSGYVRAKANTVGGIVGYAQSETTISDIESDELFLSPAFNQGSLNGSSECRNNFYGANFRACYGGIVGLMEATVKLENIKLGSFPGNSNSTSNCNDMVPGEIIVCSKSGVNVQALGGIVGMMASNSNSSIKNVSFNGRVFDSTSGSFSRVIGGIAGFSAGKIENAIVSGRISRPNGGFYYVGVGGISGQHIGFGSDAIRLSGNYADVVGPRNIGGIAGCLGIYGQSECFQSLSNGSITGMVAESFSASELIQATHSSWQSHVGGLVGWTRAGTIEQSYAENDLVEGFDDYAGGLVGYLGYGNDGFRGRVFDSYVRLSLVRAERYVGGVAGVAYDYNQNTPAIGRTYSLANIISTQEDWDETGGIVSNAGNDTLEEYQGEKNSFWLKGDGTNSNVEVDDDDGQPISSYAAFELPGMYQGANWNNSLWQLPSGEPGLPYLKWEDQYVFPTPVTQ